MFDKNRAKGQTYMADQPASPLGCTEQYQTCLAGVPTDKGCSELRGYFNYNTVPGLTREQQFLMWWNQNIATNQMILYKMEESLGANMLTARYRLTGRNQGTVPENQWQIDVERWNNMTLAAAQGAVVDNAMGRDEVLRPYLTPVKPEIRKTYCTNQVGVGSQSTKGLD